MYTCILFDLDGTLSDPHEGIYRCFRLGLARVGLEEPDDQKLRAVIGPPLFDSYTQLYGLTPERAWEAITAYRAEYAVRGYCENRLYPGITELLRRLYECGRTIVLATSKPEEPARDVLHHFGIAQYFHFVAAASMDAQRSHKDAVIDYALQSLPGIPRAQMVMVGDRHYDLFGAQRHGLDGIGVLYGYGSREELQSCPYVHLAPSPADLERFLFDE